MPQVELARTVPLSRSPLPVDLESPQGAVGRAAALRTSRALAKVGETSLLDYHLAAMRDLGAPPLLTGNQAELLIDGPRTYHAMFAAIEKAREYILVESFIFEEAEEGDRTLSRLLGAAAARGVPVHVLYDAVGSLTTDANFLDGLRQAGVSLCAFNPLNPLDDRFAGLNQRDHRKIVVVDGEQAFAGGVNFSRAYRIASRQARGRGFSKQKSLDEGWRDTHISVRGSGARHLEDLFREMWRTAACDGEIRAPQEQVTRSAGPMLLQIVPGTPTDDLNEIYVTLLSVITYAQKSIDITMAYFVPDDALEKALREAAKRGVAVRIILPSYSDFSGVFYAGRAHYDELLDSGVQLFELESAFLHSKSIVVDGIWSSIGSTNFDWRSFVHNYEADLIVHDAGFARALERRFRRDLAASVEIDPQQWRNRGAAQKLREWLARQWEYLL